MPDLRKWFHENVAHVRADSDTASRQLMDRLKHMTPADFLRLPADTFASLTAAQYEEVVAVISPDTQLPNPPPVEEIPAETRSWGDWWRERSTLTRVLTMTITTTFVVVMMGVTSPLAWKWLMSRVEIARPLSTATWPICKRLSPYTDGCLYYPAQNLNWAWVAQQLDMTVDELYSANRHLPKQYIPSNSTLIVWRHRGRLEQ